MAKQKNDFKLNIHPRMAEYITLNDPLWEDHCHPSVNYLTTPDGFAEIRMPFNPVFLGALERTVGFLSYVLPMKARREQLRNLRNFLDLFNNKTISETFQKMLEYETEPTIYVCLMMDMTFSIKGKMKMSVIDQYYELEKIQDRYPEKVMIVFAVDPNNPDAEANIQFAKNKGIKRFKIYPSLGYLPSHPLLMDLYKYVRDNNGTITAHCSSCCMKPRYKKLQLVGKKIGQFGELIDYKETVSWTKKEQYQTLNDPKNWLPVLMTYPDLRLNLAHFAGVDFGNFIAGKQRTWVADIIDMMYRYNNFYTDFSYTYWKPEYVEKLKQLINDNVVIRERVLNGTDYFMDTMEGSHRELVTRFRMAMGDDIMNQIGKVNPKRFYNINL